MKVKSPLNIKQMNHPTDTHRQAYECGVEHGKHAQGAEGVVWGLAINLVGLLIYSACAYVTNMSVNKHNRRLDAGDYFDEELY